MIINVAQAVKLIKEGKVVAAPTETVYGLAADALNPQSIARIFEMKNRPADNPLICHFSSIEQIKSYVADIPDNTLQLMNKFSPGPLSYMLNLPDDSPLKFATCGSAQVIVRIPDHPMLLEIISKINRPLAAPSANTSGKVSPTSAAMVQADLGEKVDGLVDGGECPVGIESTIVDARTPREVIILRHGKIGEKEIQEVIANVTVRDVRHHEKGVTPGSKYRHYAPDTQIFRIDSLKPVVHERKIALLLTQEEFDRIDKHVKEKFLQHQNVFLVLGGVSDLGELAKKFYATLGAIDRLGVSQAYFLNTDFGDSSLGKALQIRMDKIVSR